MSTPDPLTAEMVGRLAAHGGAPLSPDRAELLAELYSQLAPDLARVMEAEVDASPAVMFHVEQVQTGFARPLTAQGG